MYEELCITMQLSLHPPKLGNGDIYQTIYLDPMETVIKQPLGDEGGLGKFFSNNANDSFIPNRSVCETKWIQESYLFVELMIQ